MKDFDPYKDYGAWEKAVLMSAIDHAAIALRKGSGKSPGVYLYWLTQLAHHLAEHYQSEEPYDTHSSRVVSP